MWNDLHTVKEIILLNFVVVDALPKFSLITLLYLIGFYRHLIKINNDVSNLLREYFTAAATTRIIIIVIITT